MFVVKIQGGIGNQLFQYNFMQYLKSNYPSVEIYANTTFYKKHKEHGGLQIKLKPFSICNKRTKGFIDITEANFSKNNVETDKNIFFNGYWQETCFFEDNPRIDFHKICKPSVDQNLKNKIEETENSVSLHIRRGDYNNNYMHGNIGTKAYYQNAVEHIAKKVSLPTFFVFSNDINWAKDNIDFKNYEVHFIDGKDEIHNSIVNDLYLMSLCKHNIISNSSYSWWAQHLNTNNSKIVITPEYWFNQTPTGFSKTRISLQEYPYMESVPNIPQDKTYPENPFFSIVLLSYNQEDCIRRSISSVLNQTCQDFELIIVDDCSTDNTPNILKEYEEHNKKIRAKRQPANAGCHLARACGVAAARAKWLMFLDGDDWFELDGLEKLKNEIEKYPDYDMFEMPYIVQPSKRVVFPPETTENRFEQFFQNSIQVTVWNKAYNTEKAKLAFDAMLPLKVNIFEDTCESIVLSYFCTRIKQLDFYVTNYLDIQTGISTYKTDFNKIIHYTESLKNVIKDLEHFEKKYSIDKENYPISFVQRKMLDFIFGRIKRDLSSDEAVKAFHFLAREFSEEETHSFFKKMYSELIFLQSNKPVIYRIARKIYHIIKKGYKKI